MLALAVECIASSLAGYQASEVAAVFREGLSRHLAGSGQICAEVDEALGFRRDCCFARSVEVERAAAQELLAPSAAEAHPDHAAVARVDRAVEAEVHEHW